MRAALKPFGLTDWSFRTLVMLPRAAPSPRTSPERGDRTMTTKLRNPRLVSAAAVMLALCLAGARPVLAEPADLVIDHVTVLPMTKGAAAVRDATVVIRDGRIAEV